MKREFKARIVDNFRLGWIAATAKYENCTHEAVVDNYISDNFTNLSERISGKIVTLVECQYETDSPDSFEKEDYNFVIWPELYTELEIL